MNAAPVTEKNLDDWSLKYSQCGIRQLATHALAKSSLFDVAYVSKAASAMRQKFSLDIQTLEVTNQEASGRCWLFAATNVLREKIAKELDLEKFELSQSYLAFWDKFERANYFLESIIDTANLPCDDRTVSFILATGVHDGGQWDMFTNVVRKYGLVPKDVFDETYQSSHTGEMNHVLNRNLKACAAKIRALYAKGETRACLQEEKEKMLEKIYCFLCSCYGMPPRKFDFEYVDKKKQYTLIRDLTPQEFCKKYIGNMLDDTVSIINAPTADKPYNRVFTIRYLGNVVGGNEVKHLNLPIDEFKQVILRQLRDGKVVWFGSDVGKFGDRKAGIWDSESFDLELVSGLDMTLSKEDSLNYGFSAMNHAMVITGVNLDGDKPTRWKIENSWGDKNGAKGYYVCSDEWFDQYVYQAAVEKQYLNDSSVLTRESVIELEPWDPMGTLAY